MTITRFQQEWNEVAGRLGLRVQTPFVVKLAGGQVTVPVLLQDFGGPRGMLLVTDSSLVSPHTEELVSLGFGYSCLSEPTQSLHYDDDESLKEMFADWGWSGSGSPPAWYGDPAT